MNKSQLAKSVGHVVKLQPVARGRLGESIDDDWTISAMDDDSVTLEHLSTKAVARVGLDAVYSYMTDVHNRRAPTDKRGFLQLLVQITIDTNGAVRVAPLPPPRTVEAAPSPLEAETARIAKTQYYAFWSSARGRSALSLWQAT